jgi:hypothetical protein
VVSKQQSKTGKLPNFAKYYIASTFGHPNPIGANQIDSFVHFGTKYVCEIDPSSIQV